mgnify:CR=1 FL=1
MPDNLNDQLWFINIADVSADDLESILTQGSNIQLQSVTVKRIRSFVFKDDQIRALLSELLQRSMVAQTFGDVIKSGSTISINRTRENKPFPVCGLSSSKCANVLGTWNFNVSHHGRYVAIIAHPNVLVGLDIVNITTRSPCYGADDYFDMFVDQFTSGEMKIIRDQPNIDDKFTMFYIYWSLKESFIKALGTGLQYDLKRIHFDVLFANDVDGGSERIECPGKVNAVGCSGRASVRIDGAIDHNWTFEFLPLDSEHVISVARGPVCGAADSYRRSAWLHLDEEALAAHCSHCQCNKSFKHSLLEDTLFRGRDYSAASSSLGGSTDTLFVTLPQQKTLAQILSMM